MADRTDPEFRFIRGSNFWWLFEDSRVEFKMHTTIAIEDIPSHCEKVERSKVVRSRQPISKTICAFLNTFGGRIYLGIDDYGVLKGVYMTRFQVDHFLHALDDTLSRYSPRVPIGAVKLQLIPIEDPDKDVSHTLAESTSDGWGYQLHGHGANHASNTPEMPENMPAVHILRGRCRACEQSAFMGSQPFLIVMQIQKSTGPIYSNEEGLAYERTQSGNRMLNIDMVRIRLQTNLETEEEKNVLDSVLKFSAANCELKPSQFNASFLFTKTFQNLRRLF